MTMHRREMLAVIAMICLFGMMDGVKEIVVENPFYLRARIYDSQTANVLFEIPGENDQRICQKYRFTIRRNHEPIYAMPEQNLAYWRNSLELKHLAAGDYRICATICSEYEEKVNRSIPITTCVNIHAYRSHFLILTLYFLVFLILGLSQMNFTLHKREIRARIQTALIDAENTMQKWHTDHPPQSYNILQSLITLPATPTDHSIASSTHPVIFQLNP